MSCVVLWIESNSFVDCSTMEVLAIPFDNRESFEGDLSLLSGDLNATYGERQKCQPSFERIQVVGTGIQQLCDI